MRARPIHRIVGLVMLLPLVGWAVSGAIFFIKPGWDAAYESLPVKTYPLSEPVVVSPDPSWLEVRVLKTVLGEHLLARTGSGWQHLDARTRSIRLSPTEADLRALMNDAFAVNPARYGQIVSMDGTTATTDTGARVTLNWTRLSLAQRGRDTDRIDRLYSIHYLQWTGVPSIDRPLGIIGLVLLIVLSGLGLRLFFRRRS